jgi:serine/threonine protein kinase
MPMEEAAHRAADRRGAGVRARKGIVHRDLKPANIKVTPPRDFAPGKARFPRLSGGRLTLQNQTVLAPSRAVRRRFRLFT